MTVRRKFWSPRAGYVSKLVGDGPEVIWLPDPHAKPEEFAWRWYGKSDGYTVAITFDHGRVAGRIWAPGAKYALDPIRLNTELRLSNSDWWQLHPPIVQPERPVSEMLRPEGLSPSGPTWDRYCTGLLPTSASTIDVLIMYTDAVLSEYGSHESVFSAMWDALEDANQSLRNSSVWSVSFFLRGVEPVPDSFTYDSASIDLALNRLAGVSGTTTAYPGWIYVGNPAVASRRNATLSDVVALARIEPPETFPLSCGVAFAQRVYNFGDGWIEPGPEFERKSYLVFNPQCRVDRLNLAHELGHILGMEHDPNNSSRPWYSDPSCPWSFGHRRPTAPVPGFTFRTVMSYWDVGSGGGPGGCGSESACPLVDAYSNPGIAWDGAIPGLVPIDDDHPLPPNAAPIGVALPGSGYPAARGYDTIQRLAPIVAAFRSRPELIFANGFQ